MQLKCTIKVRENENNGKLCSPKGKTVNAVAFCLSISNKAETSEKWEVTTPEVNKCACRTLAFPYDTEDWGILREIHNLLGEKGILNIQVSSRTVWASDGDSRKSHASFSVAHQMSVSKQYI